MKLRYVGSAATREITKQQFKAIDKDAGGPLDHDTVKWDDSNEYVADVDPDVAKWLLANSPGQFEQVGKK